MSKILGDIWFSPAMYNPLMPNHIGIVLIETEVVKKKKAYIGCVAGHNREADIKWITDWGAPFPADIAEKLILG